MNKVLFRSKCLPMNIWINCYYDNINFMISSAVRLIFLNFEMLYS